MTDPREQPGRPPARLLEEIEGEAEAAQRRRSVEEAASKARAELDAERTRPVLVRIERRLRRLASALNARDDAVGVGYALPQIGRLDGLRQGRYQVSVDPEDPGSLRLHFECVGARGVRGVLASEAAARALEGVLVGAGLGCRRVAHHGQRRALVVEPRVPVTVQFRAQGAAVVLRTRNLAAIETRSCSLAAERVDDELLDSLLELVLRRGNRLATLIGDTVAAEDRALLRRELARSQRRRDAELGGVLKRALFPLTEAFRRLVLRQ